MPPETKIDCEHLARNLPFATVTLGLKKKRETQKKMDTIFFWFFNNLKKVD
jgi:hypothetical protein